MPRAIALVRHGETDWNLARRIQGRTEVPLNATGRAQAAATAQLLADSPRYEWSGLHSSPLGRAIETARILGTTLGLAEPTIDAALLERDFGPAEGLLVEEAQQRWPGLEVPGGESVEDLSLRAAGALERLLIDAPGTVAIAHGAMLRAGLSRLCGVDVPRILNGEVWVLTRERSGRAPVALSLGIAHPAG